MFKRTGRFPRGVNKPAKTIMDAKEDGSGTQTSNKGYTEDELKSIKITASLTKNRELVNQIAGGNADLVTRNITLGRSDTNSAALYFIESMIDSRLVDNDIMRPLVTDVYATGLKTGEEIIGQLNAGNIFSSAQLKVGKNMNDMLEGLLSGDVCIFVDSFEGVLIISSKGFDYRGVPKVEVEPSVMGPLDAFNEVLSVNIGLIRRRVQSPNLKVEMVTLGNQTRTKVCIAYIKGVCEEEIINEVRLRISRIDTDGIIGSAHIREYITDNPYTMFPLIRITERPDVTSAALLEGRVAIIVDGTPDILVVPCELTSFVQTAEDYHVLYIFASVLRLLRVVAIFIATVLPALYISVTSFHQELLPENLVESIAASRIGVPFPPILEALLMELAFELLREAGVRLARPVGSAVSIVGALVIGQAAVQANVISALMVIIVALTGIASFAVPQYVFSFPIRVSRFALMGLSAALGFYGLMLGLLFIMLHLCSLRSFGVPYLAPLSPYDANGAKDALVRFPFWSLRNRPVQIARDVNRASSGGTFKPPKNGGTCS